MADDLGDVQQLALLNNPQWLAAALSGAFGPRGVEGAGPSENAVVGLPSGYMFSPANTPQGSGAIAGSNLAQQMIAAQQDQQAQTPTPPAAGTNPNTVVPQPFTPRPPPWDPATFGIGGSVGLPQLPQGGSTGISPLGPAMNAQGNFDPMGINNPFGEPSDESLKKKIEMLAQQMGGV